MLNRLKISLILAPLSLTVVVGVYVYSLWSEHREQNAAIPFDATGALNRDLLKFHQKRGSFPETLKDLEGVVWEKKERNYIQGKRSIKLATGYSFDVHARRASRVDEPRRPEPKPIHWIEG